VGASPEVNTRDSRSNQREYMRSLVGRIGKDKSRVCEEFVAAEERGDFDTTRDPDIMTAQRYASKLWTEGREKGWLFRVGGKKQTFGTHAFDPEAR
jgi:hypothetical protein